MLQYYVLSTPTPIDIKEQ